MLSPIAYRTYISAVSLPCTQLLAYSLWRVMKTQIAFFSLFIYSSEYEEYGQFWRPLHYFPANAERGWACSSLQLVTSYPGFWIFSFVILFRCNNYSGYLASMEWIGKGVTVACFQILLGETKENHETVINIHKWIHGHTDHLSS
jgi:hypothetical protein